MKMATKTLPFYFYSRKLLAARGSESTYHLQCCRKTEKYALLHLCQMTDLNNLYEALCISNSLGSFIGLTVLFWGSCINCQVVQISFAHFK